MSKKGGGIVARAYTSDDFEVLWFSKLWQYYGCKLCGYLGASSITKFIVVKFN